MLWCGVNLKVRITVEENGRTEEMCHIRGAVNEVESCAGFDVCESVDTSTRRIHHFLYF